MEEQEQQFRKDINVFAQTNFRNLNRKFGIMVDDRRRHMYVIGKTGMGKTTMLENLILADVYAGNGVGVVDPHGDSAEKVLNYIPNDRVNDVIYFNPSDTEFPIGFNILEIKDQSHRHLVASGLMSVFKKIWIDQWSSRMEYILNNTLLALLEFPGSTLLGINRLLAEKEYRMKVVGGISDPVVKAFWVKEFANFPDRYRQEAVAPIQNKIGQFLSSSVIRNIVGQVKSTINIREAMDSGKIFIMNLSKGRIGEDSTRLLGGMLITRIQLSAMERVDTLEEERSDFFLYVDEFQNFATEAFANILSEARKYRLSLIMAHQYIEQLDETVAAAVFGNVGTIVSFRVGAADAEALAKEYEPIFTEQDIINLPKFQIYLKLMINGVASKPFSAATLPPIGSPTGNADKVIKVSRERYGRPSQEIDEMILKWSGMADIGEYVESGPGGKKPKVKEADIKKEDRHQYKAQCWRCLNMTDVPFPPDGKRPTYCRDCYPDAMKDKQDGKPAPPPPPEALKILEEAKKNKGKKKDKESVPEKPTDIKDEIVVVSDPDEKGMKLELLTDDTKPQQSDDSDQNAKKKRKRKRKKKSDDGSQNTSSTNVAAKDDDKEDYGEGRRYV